MSSVDESPRATSKSISISTTSTSACPSSPSTTVTTPRVKKTRTRSGCLNCRRKKRKCDERRPGCGTCTRRHERCEWGMKITFRAENAFLFDENHPALRELSRKTYRNVEIINVTNEVIRDYDLPSSPTAHDYDTSVVTPSQGCDIESSTPRDSSNPCGNIVREGETSHDAFPGPLPPPPASSSLGTPVNYAQQPPPPPPPCHAPSYPNHVNSTLSPGDSSTPGSLRHSENAVANLILLSQGGPGLGQGPGSGGPGRGTAADHQALEPSFGPVSADLIADYLNQYQSFTPEGPSEDGVFLPGSAYHELHSTLRNHLIQEVRSEVPSQPQSPDSSCMADEDDESLIASTSNPLHLVHSNNNNNSNKPTITTTATSSASSANFTSTTNNPSYPAPLTPSDEVQLWRNWFDEIAPWLDKFDSARHFQHIIPTMATSSSHQQNQNQNQHLRSSILALSARQIELKQAAAAAAAASSKQQQQQQQQKIQLSSSNPNINNNNKNNNNNNSNKTPSSNPPSSTTNPSLSSVPVPVAVATQAAQQSSSSSSSPPTAAASHSLSLSLYQQAIHLLLPQLPTRSTGVIASCVILCVLEMLSCSPKAWRRHLDGCASLMEAVGINGFVGGVEEALFWCFARMDVCGGLISSVKTLIPVGRWVGLSSIKDDVERFRGKVLKGGGETGNFETWSHYSVYLLAQVLDLLAPDPRSHHHHHHSSHNTVGGERQQQRHDDDYDDFDEERRFRSRWLELWGYIADWYECRPRELHAVMSVPSSSTSSFSSESSPFPTVIFSNPAAISGNQLHHTAAVLMLQNQPSSSSTGGTVGMMMGGERGGGGVGWGKGGGGLLKKPRSILWHARQICAISISNHHHGAWTNSVQPLWIAGRCMSHPAEHEAILRILGRIEDESGWGARWRAEDLKEFWGDLGE